MIRLLNNFLKINIVLVDQGIVSLSRFLLTWLIARVFGIEDYGLYVILWSFVLLLGSIQVPFIINPMLTLGSKSINKNKDDFFGSYFYFQDIFTLLSVAIMLVIFFAAKLLNIDYSVSVFTGTVLYGISYNYYEFCRRYLFTTSKDNLVLASDTLIQMSIFLMLFMAWIFEALSLELFLFGSFIVYFMATMIVKTKIRLPKIKRNFLIVRFKKNLVYSLPMLKLSVAQFFSGHFFIYVAVYLLGQNVAGVIGVLRNIFAPLVVGLMVLDNSLPQRSMEIFERKDESLIPFFTSRFKNWLIPFSIFIVGVLSFGDVVLGKLYGSEYLDYVKYLPWFACAHLLMLGVRLLSIYARTINVMNSFSVQGLLTFSFTLLLTYPLIVYLDLNGAFIVMLGQQLIMLMVLLKYVREY